MKNLLKVSHVQPANSAVPRFAKIAIGLLVGFQLLAVIVGVDEFPFSNHPMYSHMALEHFDYRIKMYTASGLERDVSEEPFFAPILNHSFWRSRLSLGRETRRRIVVGWWRRYCRLHAETCSQAASITFVRQHWATPNWVGDDGNLSAAPSDSQETFRIKAEERVSQ